MPNCTLSVSPNTMSMFSNATPRRSETICAKVVSWPWPWLWVPISTVTWPVGWTRTVALS